MSSSADELRAALSYLLAPPGERARRTAYVESYAQYIEQAGIPWRISGSATRPLALTLELPGPSAIFIPSGDSGVGDWLTEIRRDWIERGFVFAQALLSSPDAKRAAILTQAGFTSLTSLVYLDRDRAYPWVDAPDSGEADWIPYAPHTHERFIRCIQESYEDSLDCPELACLRSAESALEAHRVTGEHDPQLWELARVDGMDAGCLLLAPWSRSESLEVVYMGVSGAARRRGVGRLLLRRALAQCRARRLRRLSLAADARNAPALALYKSFSFREVARSQAWLAPLITSAESTQAS